MHKILLVLLLALGCLVARTDFSALSNQELIALIGYVKPNERPLLLKELESRKPTFSPNERQQFERAIKEKR
ncbi:DUF1104 domain-containing protein [Sulfurospirillum sp. T05]|uniref:DUF1104 domain-containing protein n=1 Tax=Sulfurospirillum tamanense TaxID=2813362 RepID=A0ABS2WTB5_9BACT|nr:DUF1104 domain-containing protein [Sulfurospirillum tamanensis]MBN2964904.1 DUF1104 domain-containing protein [Sulfurospirillum tamanensis]